MIKALGRAGDGHPLLIIGLSGESVTRLAAGEPIAFNMAEMGPDVPPHHVIIVYGKHEEDIANQLQTSGLAAWTSQGGEDDDTGTDDTGTAG